MKKILLVLSVLLFSAESFSAAKLTAEEVKSKYSIVEGNYKLISGSPSECIDGEYKILKGNDGIVSLWSGDGLIARNLHSEVVNARESSCSMNYTTITSLNGFKNKESVHCEKTKTSYNRTLIMKFQDGKIEYKLSSHRLIANKKSEVTCLLELVPAK